MRQMNADYQIPRWILEAMGIMRPPGRMTVSEWADANRVLSMGESSRPGRWKTDFTPYLRAVMDAFNNPEIEEIRFVKPTQVGGTEAMLNIMGYAICNDPAPMLVVYPKEKLAEEISDHRIQPMINSCAELKKRFDANSKKDDLKFEGGLYIGIVGANSPSDLASRPIKNLFLDEEDKFPERSGKEASPSALAMERQSTFPFNKKTIRASTPVFEDGVTWQNWLHADTQMECFVACPHCSAEWTFRFKQLKWPDGADEETARQNAFYVCEECGGIINNAQKNTMIKNCRWKSVKSNGSRRRTAYRLNTFYSPWKQFGDIAAEFIKSKEQPELLQNFINSWLAEPFKDIEIKLDSEKLLEERQSIFPRGEVPPHTCLLTGGVDVQKRCFYWTIRAWKENMTSYNLAHGQVFSWQEVEYAMNAIYKDRNGKQFQVNLCCVDSGDQTDDVYEFCAINREWAMPIKGSSVKMDTRAKVSRINKDGMGNSILLCIVDTNYYKDMIAARLLRDEDSGGWYLHDDCDPEYAEMITAEEKVVEQVRGRLIRHWKPKATGADNHYLDCEVYAACAADLAGLRTLHSERTRVEDGESSKPIRENFTSPAVVDVDDSPIYHKQMDRSSFRNRRRWRR